MKFKLTDDNFVLYAMKHYDNMQCHSVQEFEEDLRRFLYLKKLFKRYTEGELRKRLILNHLIVLYNIFGDSLNDMLLFKIDEENWPALKTFMVYLGRLEESELTDIALDPNIVSVLRKI